MNTVTENVLNDELFKSHKPVVYASQPIPFNELTDRNFETLLYHVFKGRLLKKDEEIVSICDNISLMPGVADQGRDIILSKKGAFTGLIQCKKHKDNLSGAEVGTEILKFILNYLNDPSLITDIDDFRYYFAVSTGFTGKTIGHFSSFGHYLCNEPELENWLNQIIKRYPAKFKELKYKNVESTLKDILCRIQIKKIVPQDIEYWLSESSHLYELFFKIHTVTNNALLENIIDDYLKPILKKIDTKSVDTPNYVMRFRDYLNDHFNTYSTARTLVFGNQQKKLEDFYFPLTAVKKNFPGVKTESETFLLDEFKDDFIPKYKKVIIVDDGGMGKSTLSKWLFLSCIKLNKGIPIFIELRNLNKNNDILDEITNKLNPLNFVIEKKATAKILSERGFVIFLDGYDEIKFENRSSVTKDLQNFIEKCKHSYFVITSRPEKALLSFSDFQEFNIQKLSKDEAFQLLRKIDNFQERSLRLIEQINRRELTEIEDFLSNPLLVSLLYKKFEHRESIPLKKQEFFYEVFEALFQAHDLSKGDSYIREKESKLALSDFFQILRGIAFRCINEGIAFNEARLMEIIELVRAEFAKEFDAYLFLNDLTKAVPLFVRDGLMIRWAHKSIQQYFSAEYICRDSKQNQEKILLALYKSDRVSSYEPILKLCYEIDYKSFRSSILFTYCQDFILFFENQLPNLTSQGKITKEDIDLRKALLFRHKIAIIKCPEILDEDTGEQTTIINYALFEKDFDVSLYGAPQGYELIAHKNILDFDLRRFLHSFGNDIVNSESFINPDDLDGKILPEELPMEPDLPFYLDNDDTSHVLNEPKYFRILNEILLGTSFLIDIERAKYIYDVVKREKDINEEIFDRF